MIDMNEIETNTPDTEVNIDEAVEAEQKSDDVTEEKNDKKNKKASAKELKELKESADMYQKQYEEINDKYLRMIAEYDNFRRRTAKEKEALYSDTVCDVVKTLLPVVDNLERAVVYDGNTENADGITMILKNFVSLLENLGVTEIEALGKTFDPNLHNAIMHIEDEQYGENEVYNVLQKGYVRGDKIIRHAMVMVAN